MEYEDLNAVRSKITGNVLYVESDLTFEPDAPCQAIAALREQLQEELTREFGRCSVSVMINGSGTAAE